MSAIPNVKRAPESKKEPPAVESKAPDDALSAHVTAINVQVLETLGHLNALIDNRAAWADGIEGCREAVTLLRALQGGSHEILEQANQLESDLSSARAEIVRWNKMHAELTTVERALRAENTRLRDENAGLSRAEEQLNVDARKHKTLIESHAKGFGNLRLLAQEMVREIGGIEELT